MRWIKSVEWLKTSLTSKINNKNKSSIKANYQKIISSKSSRKMKK